MPFIKQNWLRKIGKNEKQQKKGQKVTKIEEIDNDILMIKNGIKVAEKLIKEGNLELEKQLKQSNLKEML